MNAETITRANTVAAAVAILAFLWTLHTDLAGLGVRMARLEGSFGVLTEVLVDRANPD